MKIRAKNGGQTVDITLPATDMDMQYCMKCIGIEDIVPVCCISEVWDEPSYFGFLKGQTVSMDELNFFARRLDGMTEYEKRVVGVYSSETGMREMKQLINLTYSLQGLSLITDLTDGNRVGLRLYLDRHLAISEEEKSRMDFNAYAQKIFSEGKCKFLPHGILVDQGFHMEGSETGIREMKQLINLTYSLQGLSLLTDLTDGNRVGLRLYLDRHLAISEEEKSKMDFNAYAQKIFSEGKCKFLPHGILVDQGFQMEEVYNGKTFPEYIDRPDETVAVLSLENEAGDKEYLYLPTDISAMDKVKKRLNIAAFAEGIVNGIENIRLPESILPSPEDMCMSLQGDVQKLTLFNEMCQTVSCFDEAKMDRLAMAAGFVGTSEFTDITYIAKHLDEFEIHPQIHTDKEYGEFLVKEAGMFEVDELLLPHIDYAGVARDKRQATMADSGFIPEGFVGTQRAIHEYQEYQGEFADLLEKNGIPCETFCLYSSLAGMMYQDGEEQETLYRSELADYEEQIQKAILKERHVEEEPRGLMHYFDGNRQVAAKVISAFPRVQNIRGELFGVLECSICQPLTQNEIYELKNFWDGQMSDGWGEGFEQRPIYTQEGELYVSFWTQERHWGVMTEEELDRIWNHGMTQTL